MAFTKMIWNSGALNVTVTTSIRNASSGNPTLPVTVTTSIRNYSSNALSMSSTRRTESRKGDNYGTS